MQLVTMNYVVLSFTTHLKMTAQQFNAFWSSAYPASLPISHTFKDDYKDRWFRIHSLPGSKRYADNKEDWEILLGRQNEIITDLVGNNAEILFVTGDYYAEGVNELHPISAVKSIATIEFVSLDHIDLHKWDPIDNEAGEVFRPIFSEQTWQAGKFDNLLTDIADDQLKAFFVSIENNCIVAPYDGGMDIILQDTQTKDRYKAKYNDWLSAREDGL
jgi:hypothetical protein